MAIGYLLGHLMARSGDRRRVKALCQLLGKRARSAQHLAIVYPIFNPAEPDDGRFCPCYKEDPATHERRPFAWNPPKVLDIHDVKGVMAIVEALTQAYHRRVPFISDEDHSLEKWLHSKSFVAVGGPLTNLLSRRVLHDPRNDLVTIDDKSHEIVLPRIGQTFRTDHCAVEDYAVVLGFSNPADSGGKIIVCAGIGDIGTNAACIFLANRYKELAEAFQDQPFAVVLRVLEGRVASPHLVASVPASASFG
jgi:hypothetical protein